MTNHADAIHTSPTIRRPTRSPTAITLPVTIESTIGPSPNSSLPVAADNKALRLSGVELEAVRARACATLGCETGVDDFTAIVGHDEREPSGTRFDPRGLSALHVVESEDGRCVEEGREEGERRHAG